MHYKTICLQMIQEREEMYNRLLTHRNLLPTLERYATQLKTSHLDWQELLSQARPDSSASQIADEALEIALKELEDTLPPASPQDEALSLDAAMAFITRRTQTA